MAETEAFFTVTIAAGSGTPLSLVVTVSRMVSSLLKASLSVRRKDILALNTTKRLTDRLCRCFPLFRCESVDITREKLLTGGAAQTAACWVICIGGDGFGKTKDDVTASGEGEGVGIALDTPPIDGEEFGRATTADVREVRDIVEDEDKEDGSRVDEEEELEDKLLAEATFASDAASSPSKIRFLSAARASEM
jgi:hypothetical protein